jgi:hypothetical protein
LERDSIFALLKGYVPAIISGLVLLVFGVGFLARAIAMLVDVYANQAVMPPPDIGTLVADLLLSIIWIVGGICLVLRKPLGYASGLGLLFSTITLIAGLIIFLLIEPVFTEAPFVLGDVIAVGTFGLISIIPFVLYLRGVISKGSQEDGRNLDTKA